MSAHAVIYAAKSTEDKHGSIPAQIKDCRKLAEREGWEVVDAFSDEAFSAFSGNRGPGLERAKLLAAKTAAEHGRCVLVAQDADRFARGAGDTPGAADHLAEVYFAMKRQGVELWTCRNGQIDLMRAAFEGMRSHDESARKTQSVKAGKRRQAERGQHLGGPLADGYVRTPEGIALDPERAEVMRDIFALAAEGKPDSAIARSLNARDLMTRRGNPWTRRTVQNLLCNVFYTGRIAYEDDIFDGLHPALIKPAVFDQLKAARAKRDLGKGSHVIGRPAKLHALMGLANCGCCNRRMLSWTSAYTRKDGGKQRTYRCRGYSEANGTCSVAQFDAGVVDAAVLAALEDLLPDFETWLAQVTERQSGERDRLDKLVEAATAERDGQAATVAKLERRWVEADDRKADSILPMVERERQSLADAETRLSATEGALEATPVDAPVDALLDFGASLQRALRGIDTNGSMAQVNAALSEVFDSFDIWIEDQFADPAEKQIRIEPNMHMGVFHALLAQGNSWTTPDPNDEPWKPWLVPSDAEPPPMEWLAAPLESGSTPRRI